MKSSSNLILVFDQIEDHRSHINKRHNLIDILLIGIILMICGAELRSTSRVPKKQIEKNE